ncbi:MAG: sulfatase [Planctomycetales bacterium]|nr:sulfatase [Planctomycetales bacterium]
MPLNVLLFTADDLNCDSLGCYGCKTPDITPNLDRFAAQGMRFERAHVNVAICQPSRGVLATGRYSHRSGITGFYHTDRDIPTIMQSLREHGYLTGVLGKVGHSTPKANYRWDLARDQGELGAGRDPREYARYCREFFEMCERESKPFYFMVNSHDPHRPYHDPAKPPFAKAAATPTRLYATDEATIPGFLPDLPGVRTELSHYFNSVRRCDDTFGAVMKALDDSGMADRTLVMFLSDNGIAVPFAKCNCYLSSTRTPWLVRWPQVIRPASVDRTHFVSGVDFFPTVMDALGLPIPDGVDGVSFVPLLRGESQTGRERVFTQIDRKAGGDFVPMRCVQDERFGYIFNPWADGKFRYRNNNEGLSMRAMESAAATDPTIAERVRLFRFRDLEEFYDLRKDPDSLHNLVDDPNYAEELQQYRDTLAAWMKRTEDPALAAFASRESPAAIAEYLRRERASGQKPKK